MLMLPVTAMPVSEMQTPMVRMVPMMVTRAGLLTIRLGEPLRGRAFRSNLRFAPISTAIPLASVRVRSLRAPLAGQPDTPCRRSRHRARHPLRSPRAGASRSARRGPRLARPGRLRRLRASPRLGQPLHSVPRRCRLRRAPACAPRPALVPAQVRTLVPTLPPPPPATCYARLPAAPAAPPATQSPWRLPSAGFADVDSPIAHTADLAVLTARGGLGFHTRRTFGAWRAYMPTPRLLCPRA